MKLCSTCTKLDIHKLILLSNEDGFQKYETLEDKLVKAQIPTRSEDFFLHKPNLSAVRETASSCDLCLAIWHDYTAYQATPHSNNAPDSRYSRSLIAKTNGDLGPGATYIAASPRNVSKQGRPQIVAFRNGPNESIQILGLFDVFVEHDTSVKDADLLLRSISPHSGSDECLKLARTWLDTCLKQHHLCKPHRKNLPLPARLLELNHTNNKVRLINSHGITEPFAALSYSWGGESAQMLEAQSERQFRNELPPAALPPTMRDAVIVTHKLGLRYLWIDALCIFQDSAEDFARESAKMRDIYRGAVVTIAGSNAAKISDGILESRQPPTWTCALPWNDKGERPVYVHLRSSKETSETSLQNSPINTRGWCLQESLLAPRTLWFGSPINIFECATGQFDEAGRTVEAAERYRSKALIASMDATDQKSLLKTFRNMRLPSAIQVKFPGAAHKTILTQGELHSGDQSFTYYDHWRTIIQHYSERRLTRHEDVLPALSGMAAHFQSALGDTYLAGGWKGDILRCLCWTVVTKPGQKLMESCFPETPYSAPSWSWASTKDLKIVFLPFPNVPDASLVMDQKAKLISHNIEVSTVDPHGKIQGGYIDLRGHFLPVPAPSSLTPSQMQSSSLLDKVGYLAQGDGYKKSEFEARHVSYQDQQFGLFHICNTTESFKQWPMKTAFLLLVETTADGKNFRRVGHLSFRLSGSLDTEDDKAQLKDFKSAKWEDRTIRLV